MIHMQGNVKTILWISIFIILISLQGMLFDASHIEWVLSKRLPVSFIETKQLEQENTKQEINDPSLSQISNYMQYCKLWKHQCNAFFLQPIVADTTWIELVNYAWSNLNIYNSQHLYNHIQRIHQLDPSRREPFIFGLNMIPYGKTQNSVSMEEKKTSRDLASKLWNQAIQAFCDTNRLISIERLDNSSFATFMNEWLWRNLNPCTSYLIPDLLGFIRRYFFDDIQNATKLYKVAAAHQNAPTLLLQLPLNIAIQVFTDNKEKRKEN